MPVTINGTTGIAGVNGSATTPALQGGDTNTGMFFPAADTIAFAEGGVESMRIDATGSLSLTAPATTFYIQPSTTTNNALMRCVNTGGTAYVGLDNSTGGLTTAYALNLFHSGAYPITFSTSGTERARIDSSGNLLIDDTSSSASAGSGIKFLPADGGANTPRIAVVTAGSTAGSYSFSTYSTGAGAYRFYVTDAGVINATSTTITGISDVRFKENIRDLDDGLEKVLELKPRKFDWKEGKGADIKDARGFIAQEFEQVFPDMIEDWLDPAPDGEEPYKAVNANLIPTLVKAIQELSAKLDAAEARIAALEAN